ncbi:MAG: saccharopine dehydrogenase NADP-binding domain-containing protein [Bryobacteraceae bacterium]
MSRRATFGIVGAYGATGKAVVAELLKSTGDAILVGGRDSAKLAACAAEFGSRVSPLTTDILDPRSLDAFCRECSVVINCGGPVAQLQDHVAQSALRERCHYVDPAGMGVVKERIAPLEQEILDHRLSFVVSAGWSPGITELLPVYAHSRMDSADSVEVYFADSGEWSDSALRDGVAHLRSVGIAKPGYFRKGKWVQAKTSEASRKVDVGSPIGLRRFSLFYLPEQSEVGRRLSGCDFRCYAYLAGARNALDAMMIALLPLSEASAMRRLRNIFRRNRVGVGGFVIVRLRGRSQGRSAVSRFSITFDSGRDYWIHGVTLATVAGLISRGPGVRPGVHFLSEAVEPALLMQELRKAGVRYSETEESGP